MKVLWITNIIFPAPCKEMGQQIPVYGGWMMSSLEALREISRDIDFAVATVYSGKELKVFYIDSITYYLLPSSRSAICYDSTLEPLWRKVQKDFNPDVVHIHGTEFAYGLSYIHACGVSNVCVSIQGLVSVIAKYYYSDISTFDILKNITFRDIVRMDTVFRQKKSFKRRGELEKEYIRLVSHVIGRTSWDKSHVWAINPFLNYHVCNETLRKSFYEYKWNYHKCDKYTIFLSQASYPIKGLHKVLEALPFILRFYPKTRLRIAGESIIDKPFYKVSGYGKYIRSLIKKLNLDDKVTFLGPLSEREMCSEFLKANVFLCPSSIENSPNSLGEAQLLGVPHLASYVGGIMDIMRGEEEYIYRFEESQMLAKKICDLFEKDGDFSNKFDSSLYDSKSNALRLISIYDIVCK